MTGEKIEDVRVVLPDIGGLQTLGRPSSYRQALYLVPGVENYIGGPVVVVSTGWPKEAQQNR